jgi:hypothetical protein
VPDGIRWHEAAIEVHSLDLGIRGDDLERAAYGFDRGSVVSGTADDPLRSGEPLSDASDERALTAIGHCVRIQNIGGRIAPLCRVGRSNEPAKAGGAAVVGRASGFLETEACTTRDLAARLGFTLAQTSLRKPSRAKQERDDLIVRPREGQGSS